MLRIFWIFCGTLTAFPKQSVFFFVVVARRGRAAGETLPLLLPCAPGGRVLPGRGVHAVGCDAARR